MIIVAERINASRKSIREALEKKDADFIRQEAQKQSLAGADYIDLNGGTFPGREAELLGWLVEVAQEATDLPLCLDSPDPEALKVALPKVKGGRPLINSVSLESGRFERVLALAKEHGARVIALCQADQAPEPTVESKMALARRLVEGLLDGGLAVEDIFVDPLVFPVAVNPQSALATALAFEEIHKAWPGIHTICGMTNVSHGFPARKLINRAFVTGAISRGLDSAILDPLDRPLVSAVMAAEAAFGRDEFGLEFINAFQDGKLVVQ